MPILPDVDWRVGVGLAADALISSNRPTADERDADLRRARLGLLISWTDWSLVLGAEFAHRGILGPASVEYRGLPVYFKVGRFPEPFGLVQQEGARAQTLLEVPQAIVLTPGYGYGLAGNWRFRRSAISAGIFAPVGTVRAPYDYDVGRKEAAWTVRVTGKAWQGRDSVVHLGASYSRRRPEEDTVRFIAVPETLLLGGLNTDSAPVPTDEYTVSGFELGVQSGSVLLQAEITRARMADVDGIRPVFSGYYAEVAWALSGERRDYSTRHGVFGPILRSSPYGAFEIAARFSSLDLTSNDLGDLAAARGGPQYLEEYSGESSHVASVALVWHMLDELKITLQHAQIHNETRSQSDDARLTQARLSIQY